MIIVNTLTETTNQVDAIRIITLILALIGALAWTPWLFEKFKKAKIDGKILSYVASLEQTYTNHDRGIEIKGIGYFLKLSLTILNKDFFQKEVKVSVKYPSDSKKYKGEIFLPHNYTTVLKSLGGEVKLKVKNEDLLQFNNILIKDKVHLCYLTFIVDKANYEEFELIEFDFYDYKGKKKTLIIKRSDIDLNNVLLEEDIWVSSVNHG